MSSAKSRQFFPFLLLRTPAFPYTQYKNTKLATLLSDSFFLAALKTASTDVYTAVEKAGFEESELSERLKFTLLRYFNRMCFRPTPFGTCSAVSGLSWSHNIDNLTLEKGLKAIIHPDFSKILEAAEQHQHSINAKTTYAANDTLYSCGEEYRYLTIKEDEKRKRSYGIEAATRTPYLDGLLAFCKQPRPLTDLTHFMQHQHMATEEQANAFVQALINAQLLQSVLQSNITGADYTDILAKSGVYLSLASGQQDLLPGVPMDTQPFSDERYINSIRSTAGTLSTDHQKVLGEALDALETLVQGKISGQLKDFKEQFGKKFDQQSIPLLQAVDPEIGVGYAGLGSSIVKPKFNIPDHSRQTIPPFPWSEVHSLFINKIQNSKDKFAIILSREEIAKLPKTQALHRAPSTSVVFRLAGEQLYIEQAGGSIGTSILGRFSKLLPTIHDQVATIAAKEEQMNPNVVFAEIAHFSDPHVANIERRNHFYSYEIPVLTGTDIDKPYKITLADLWVKVEKDEIILISKTLNKRVIPRLSSAYNFTRSDLAIFRFLCDLQYQGLLLQPNFHLENYFPGLSFYPRVQYRSTILQLATWKIDTAPYVHLRNSTNSQQRIEGMKAMAKQLELPRYFSVDAHDNQLIFDLEDNRSLELLSFSFKPGTLSIKEFPFSDCATPAKNEQQEPYINQFIATLYHNENIYRPSGLQLPKESAARKFLPLREWVYFKLYCHPGTANEILSKLNPLIASLEKNKVIKTWFFIRYADPVFHIRLRFKVEKALTINLCDLVMEALQKYTSQNRISDFQISTYERELERYPAEVIEQIECCFQSSSNMILGHLSNSPTTEEQFEHYHFPINSIHSMLQIMEIGIPQRLNLFRSLYEGFSKEFSIKNEQVSSLFRDIRQAGILKAPLVPVDAEDQEYQKAFAETHQQLLKKIKDWEDGQKLDLLASLIHMHLNRFFTTDARRQELVMYYTLFKTYESVIAMERKKLLQES